MAYPLIDIKTIFVYKALPAEMKNRVLRLPAVVQVELPPITGFPKVDVQAKIQALKAIDWESLPERNLTGCALIDEFALLVHTHHQKRLSFFAKALGGRYNSQVLGHSILALMGITAAEFVVIYMMMMIRDLQQRTDLKHKEVAQVLGFTSQQTYTQFLRVHSEGKRK